MKLGPLLPYVDSKQYVPFNLINETTVPIEVYSLQYDKEYLKEEKMLYSYKKFETNKRWPVPVRAPGSGFWKEVADEIEIANRTKQRVVRITEIDEKLKAAGLEEEKKAALLKEKEELEQAKLQDEAIEIGLPQAVPKVKDEKKVNIVIFGWEKCGKSAICDYFANKHKRGIILMCQLLQWNMQKNMPVAQKAQKYLAEKAKEYEVQKEEKEKKMKKLKKGDPEPILNEADFKVLPKEILVEMLKNRMREEDCNAGAIFDNLISEHYKGEVEALEVISEACESQNLRAVLLQIPDDHPTITTNETKEIKKDDTVQETPNKEIKKEETKNEEATEEEKQPEDAKPVFIPKKLSEEEKKQYLEKYAKMEQKMSELTVKALASQQEPIIKKEEAKNEEIKKEEAKKEEVKKEESKKEEKAPEVKKQEEEKIVNIIKYGDRIYSPIEMIYEQDKLFEAILEHIPSPEYPDPSKEPLPPAKIEQLISRPKELKQAPEKILEYTLMTKKKVNETVDPSKPIDYEEKTRWVIPSKESQEIFVKFYSEKPGLFERDLEFGIVGSDKLHELKLSGKCEYPQLSDKPKAVFALYEKKQARNAPPLQKKYEKSRNCFEFGPLLLGKEFDKRQQEKCKPNLAEFVFTNTGQFALHVDFILRSQSLEYQTEIKSPFYIEPSSLDIPYQNTEPFNVKVWAFPEKAIEYKDALICIIKDNPRPATFNLSCFGAQPEVKVDSELITFEKLLINQTATKELKITNTSRIKVAWQLQGIEKLPKEFTVSPKEGTGQLSPGETATVEFNFAASEQKEYEFDMVLNAKDKEIGELKQEPKAIKLKAKSYIISVAPRFESEKAELDFGAVRVGEVAERKFFVKNSGLYEVNYKLILKTKEYRERFTITDMQGVLNAGEEKQITVAFKSKTGWEQVTNNSTTGMALQILEGNSGKERDTIPIKVQVKAVYSQFSIAPVRGINFGPMQNQESKTMSFEIKNDGKFEFNFTIYDFKNSEMKKSILEQRAKEIEDLGKNEGDSESKPKKAEKKEKKEEKKPTKGKGKADIEGGLKVGQFTIVPSTGDIAAGSSTIIKITFEAEGAKFYESNLAIDIANRNFEESPEGMQYQLVGESCIPGINAEDMQSIFEEQMVINSLDPSSNVQSVISKSLYSIDENVFLFGTLVPSKDTKGQTEKFKITNTNKIPCSVKLSVKPRTVSKSEGCSFEVNPTSLKILPHESQYVCVCFKPTNIMSYGGIFEAIVDNGDPKSKSGKLKFELRGEGVLPTVLMEKPNKIGDDNVIFLKFKRTRIGNTQKESIVLKNDGSVAATVQFEPIASEIWNMISPMMATLPPKSYQSFEIAFEPKEIGESKYTLKFSTVNNPYETQKVNLVGECYQELAAFENLPDNAEDELRVGDCPIERVKKVQFAIASKSQKCLKFEWLNFRPEIKFYPRIGFLKPQATKQITFVFKAKQPLKLEAEEIWCRLQEIQLKDNNQADWDETMTETRMVRPSELKLLIKHKAEEERKRFEENESIVSQIVAQKTAATTGKPGKQPDKKKEVKKDAKKEAKQGSKDKEEKEDDIKIIASEPATEEIEEPIKEPESIVVENSAKEIPLKCSIISDYPKYECSIDKIAFKPTLMFQTRSYKFSLKNKSLISFDYSCKITNAETGVVDYGPYNIIPRKGVIQAGCEESFILKFSPIDAEDSYERLMVISIPNLDPELKPLVIEIDGSSERPLCHFELPPSKYREKKEKDMAPIDNKYSIIEFESLGTKVKNIKRFMVVNPTSQGYEFEWMQEEEKAALNKKNMFRCLTPKGIILSGKKFEMAFEYIADSIGTHESYWEFKIPTEKVVQQFLVVGQVIEPLVLFESAKVDFGPLLVGGKNREVVKLVNKEHIPFAFAFDYKSVKGIPEDGESIVVNPMKGVVEPQGNVPIEITFIPKFEKAFNYNLVCKVKRKGRPMNINVKGVGYSLRHEVYIENGKAPVLPKDNLAIDFGDFYINEKKVKTISISNLGEFNFDFIFKRAANRYVTINPESGSVKKGSKMSVEFTYFPITPNKLAKYIAALTIVSGPTYEFLLSGSGRKPGVEFSFQKCDFGKCFVMKQPLSKSKTLEIKNKDNTALSIDLLFEKKQYLDVQLNPGQVLLPYTEDNQEKISIPIIFTPRDIEKYEETITFDFNGIYKANVVIAGEGIPLVLELTRVEDQFLDFGVVKVGGESTRTATLVNKSKMPVTFKIFPEEDAEFKKCCLSLSLDTEQEISLKPNENLPIEITYQPTLRMPAFKHDITIHIKDSEKRRLTTVTGVSHGIEVKFIEDTLGFGSVVKGSRLTKQLQMANFGDIDAKFSWDMQTISKNFTIIPDRGHIPPHEDLYFEIVFHPEIINNDIRYEKVPCKIEGTESLSVTLIGKCVEQLKENTKDLQFTTEVRTATTLKVTIDNQSAQAWTIKPTISTILDSCKDYFKGKSILEIPPKGKGDYEITYLPFTMTKESRENPNDENSKLIMHYHEASLFFPLPDGSALLYRLFGESKPPQALDTIKEKAMAKKQKFISIPVKNWLNEIQRFAVSWELEENTDPATFIRGANTFDVGSSSSKDYKLNFLAYKEGNCNFKLTFKNETTGEFVFYNIEIVIEPTEIISQLELASVVRESVSKVITIDNPLQSPVTIEKSQFEIESEYVFVTPETITIPPQRESAIEINFRPLVVEETECKLTLTNPDLGVFPYKLKLTGIKSTTLRSLHFKASLGSELVQAFRFTHYVKTQTTYTMKIERISGAGAQGGIATDFKCDQASISAQGAESHNGAEISVNVKFEPNNIGESRAILLITNPDGVEYSCLLYGHASAPQPQPITKIMNTKTVNIEFKNPLSEKCEFAIRFDNPCFTLATKLPGPLESGKGVSLPVKFDFKEGESTTGRMMISTKDLPAWIYYLHGEK